MQEQAGGGNKNRMQGGRDGPGQRDKKPHDLLQHRPERISAVDNIASTLRGSELNLQPKKNQQQQQQKQQQYSRWGSVGRESVGEGRMGGGWSFDKWPFSLFFTRISFMGNLVAR